MPEGYTVTTLTVKAVSFSISFSQHACGNPLRYATKAPPEPEKLYESIAGAGAFNLAPGLSLEEELTAKILPGNGLLTGTPLESSVVKEQVLMNELTGRARK